MSPDPILRHIKVDTHEPKTHIAALKELLGEENVEVVPLETSDYMCGDVGFERKSDDIFNIKDVIAKSKELKSQFPIAVLIISKSLSQVLNECTLRNTNPDSIIGMISSLVAIGVIPIFADNEELLVKMVARIALKVNDGKDRSYIDPLRPVPKLSDYKRRVLMGFKGVGETLATDMIEHFGTIEEIFREARAFSSYTKKEQKEKGLTSFASVLTHINSVLDDEDVPDTSHDVWEL